MVNAGRYRLLQSGVPATTEHGVNTEASSLKSKAIADVTAGFITLMDAGKMNMCSVDTLQPLLNDIVSNLSKVSRVPVEFEGKSKMLDWLTRMNSMSASDSLDETQTRQLLHDLDKAYAAFHRSLE